ncbi:MAG: hypothetical protein WBI07_03910 [Mobilitalea sp.]
MSLLIELNRLLCGLHIPVETGTFSGIAPDEYVVITPLVDSYALHSDNVPGCETQEARMSLFTKGNYNNKKRQIERELLKIDITVTERRYVGHESDTGYHHYAIDVANYYELEE